MIGMLICAAVAAGLGWFITGVGGGMVAQRATLPANVYLYLGLALIAVALWLAYAAGAAP